MMQGNNRTAGWVLMLAFAVALPLACAASQDKAAGKSSVAVSVKPTAKVMAMAQNPTPPADAKKMTSVGDDKLAVDTANAGDDVDMVWAEKIDIDGDGSVEDTQILYDSEDGVLYFYAEDDVPCAGGGTATAALLICVNCKGNSDNKPAGSGWAAVLLDAGECGAQAAGIYACRFDQNGTVTAFAAARIDEKNDDVVIVAAERD